MTKLYQTRSAPRASLWLCACASLLALASVVANGQVLPGSPVLLTEGTGTTTRAVAYEAMTFASEPFTIVSPYNWNANKSNGDRQTRVMLFAMNLSLLPGEGGNSLSADAVDAAGKVYPLKVEALNNPKYLRLLPAPDNPSVLVPTEVAQPWLFAVTLRLDDAMTENMGDVLVSVNLHGLRSNRVRIRIGQGTASPAVDPSVEYAAPAPAAEPTPLQPLAPKAYGPNEASEADTLRLLEQATWGPTSAEVARARQMGLRAFVEEQLDMPPLFPEQGSDYPAMHIPRDGLSPDCPVGTPNQTICARENYILYPVQVRFFTNAFYGGDQLHQRVAFALHQIMTVSGRDILTPSWYTTYLQTLDRHAFGSYRALLREMTLNPTMGQYLDMRRSTALNPNENFAREVLQLFSIGTDELNRDGTPKLDASGRRIPSYTQDTVENFTRVFTGWDLDLPPDTATSNFRDPMVPRTGSIVTHDTGAKTLLRGTVLTACPGSMTSQDCARRDLDAAIDNIFNHPNVGPFVGRQLIQHLVTSNPSPAYVERVARAFNDDCDVLYPVSCTSARGNLKAVVRAILLDPEARGDIKTDPSYGRLREPVQYMNNILRAFNVRSFDGGSQSDGVLGSYIVSPDFPAMMDQAVYRPVSVFGYFTPDYVIPGANVGGPPFAVLTTSTTLVRANFVNTLVHVGVNPNSTPSASPSRPRGTSIDLSPLVALASDAPQLVSALDRLMLHGTMSQAMRASLLKAVESIPSSETGKRAQMALYVVATSPQYEVQR
jgi:hypothetical protein